MAYYNYRCLDCVAKLAAKLKREPTGDEELANTVFETAHGMSATGAELRDATECPRCGGHHTEKTFLGDQNVTMVVAGQCFINRSDCRRVMDLHKLETTDEDGTSNDPYHKFRQPGEADDLKDRLKKLGQYNPHTKYFINKDADK